MVSTPLVELQKFTSLPSVIIATGPSALNYDWSSLEKGPKLIWAVNGAPTMLAKHGLRCDFLVVSDHRFGRDGADHIALAVKQGATLLLTHEAAAGFAAARPEVLAKARFHVFEKVNRWYGLPALAPAELLAANEASGLPFFLRVPPVAGVGWSHDPLLGVFAGKTVPFAALQLVVWAGSEMIEIVGMDLGGAGHAYHEDQPTVSHLEKDYLPFILPSFECMAAALAGSPSRILNHSPTCPLPKELFTWRRLVS
jgi:KDO transferase-3